MENTGKQKHKFNAVDGILIVLIIAVIGAVGFIAYTYLFGNGNIFGGGKKVTVEYKILATGVADEFGDCIKVNTPISDSLANYRIGTVTDVSRKQAMQEMQKSTSRVDENGNIIEENIEIVNSEYVEHWDYTITVQVDTTVTSQGSYLIDGDYTIAVGKRVDFHTPDFAATGYCSEICEVEKGE